MAFEWIDSLLNGNKQTKEANITPQGTNRDDHFAKKIEANDWIKGVSELDADKVEAEYLAAQAAEARALGKTAAHEFKSDEEVLKADKERATKILSDYALAEMLAELRCSKEQNTQEMFHEAKEKAKKEVASSREKAEKALMDMIPENTHLDWKKAFERFSKEATPEQPKEKDLYEPKVTDKDADFSKPSEDKFKMPTKDEMVPAGNGREADQRTEVTKEAVPVIKEASKNKKAEYQGWTNSQTWQTALWIDNEQSLNQAVMEMVPQYTEAYQLGDAIKEMVEEMQPNLGNTMWQDMLTWALAEVNWREIAESYMQKASEASKLPKVEKKADAWQHKTGEPCSCRPGMQRDNCPSCEGTGEKIDFKQIRERPLQSAMNPLKREELPVEKEGCPVCGSLGKDTGNGQIDHMACEGCGISYSSKTAGAHEAWDVFLNGKEIDTIFYTADPKRTAEDVKRDLVNHDGYDANIIVKKGSQEIKSQASKAETIKKVAEINSPWVVQKLEDGTEVIARRDISELNKESDEHKDEEIQK